MSRSRVFTLVALAVIAGAAALLLFGDGGGGSGGGGNQGWGGGGGGGPVAVRVAEVTHGPFVARADYVASLEARASADLYARSSGPVVALSADLGDRVNEGQVLARIDAAEERERLEQASANLRMAEATLTQRRSALQLATTNAERTGALYDQSLVSRQQQDAVQAELDAARAQVQLAEAQVEQARAARSAAEVELTNTRVVAPFDGLVGRRYLDLGDFAAANSPVMSVVDLSVIRTTVALPERDAALIAVGRPATVRVGSLPGQEFAGRVARVGAVFDPGSATTRAEIEVDNADRRLKPGMFATVSIALDEASEAPLVPAEAVLEEEGRSWVFLVETKELAEGAAEGPAEAAVQKVARRTPVRRLGTTADDRRVAVDGPLVAGDTVITLGHEALADGAAVRVAAPGEGAEADAAERAEVAE